MRAREGREVVVKRVLVGEVDGGELEAPLVLVAFEQVVLTKRRVEDVALGEARRVVVVVGCARCGNAEQAEAELRRLALVEGRARNIHAEQIVSCCLCSVATESRLKLPVGAQGQIRESPGDRVDACGNIVVDQHHCGLTVQHGRIRRIGAVGAGTVGIGNVIAGGRSGYEAAVESPIEGEPGRELTGDPLLDGFVLLFVVIDAKRIDDTLGESTSGSGACGG